MKPFALLMAALEETDRVAIAKVAMRQKEQLCTLRIYEGTIALETMFYSDEVRSPEELAVPGENVKVNDRELEMAETLVDDAHRASSTSRSTRTTTARRCSKSSARSPKARTIEAPAPEPAKITDLIGGAAGQRRSSPEAEGRHKRRRREGRRRGASSAPAAARQLTGRPSGKMPRPSGRGTVHGRWRQ